MDPKTLEFKITDEWKKAASEESWREHIAEFARDSKNNLYMRRRGSNVIYKAQSQDDLNNLSYDCAQCGAEIQGASVAHPIWDGPFPCSGSGKCHYETVPYCPKCEKKPDFHGSPIRVDWAKAIVDDLYG